MDLFALDNNLNVVSVLSPDNVQWNRKYYEVGGFSVRIAKEDYYPTMAYVYMRGRKELGVINKPLYEEEGNEKYIQLIGFFSEIELNDKIIFNTFYANGNIETEIKRMISENKQNIPNLVVPASTNLGSNIQFQETHGELATVGYKKLKTQEMSQRIEYDFENKIKTYVIYKGKDRTQSQFENNLIVFSSNLSKVIATQDDSNYKNFALVGGEGKGKDRIYTTVDLSSGGYQKQMFVDASSIRYDPEKQTKEQYIESLKQYGLEKLLEHQKIANVDATASAYDYEYLVDYDLGDKVDVMVESLQIALETRIIEIYEVFKDNTHTIELVFGDKILAPYQKERN